MRREYSLIIAAMEVEFDALKNQLNEYREIKFDNDNLIENLEQFFSIYYLPERPK